MLWVILLDSVRKVFDENTNIRCKWEKRRRKREDSIDGVSNSNDNEDGDHDGQDNVDMDPFLLPLSNGKRLFSLEDEGNNETFNFD